MKNIFFVVIILTLTHFVNAQTYYSKNPGGKTYKMTLDWISTYVTINREIVYDYQGEVETNVVLNATDRVINEDTGVLELGDPNKNYWFVPFYPRDEIQYVSGKEPIFKCGCGGYMQPGEGCKFASDHPTQPSQIRCREAETDPCPSVCIGFVMWEKADPQEIKFYTGGIFIEADGITGE